MQSAIPSIFLASPVNCVIFVTASAVAACMADIINNPESILGCMLWGFGYMASGAVWAFGR